MNQDGHPTPVSVVCVLRVGGEYTFDHVIALHEQVARWWPHDAVPLRFVCLTDDRTPTSVNVWPGIEVHALLHRWPGWWSKMEIMLGAHDDLGDVLYMDLDTMVVGPLDRFAVHRPLTLLDDFYRPTLAQSGLMWLPARWRVTCAAMWLDTPQEHMKQFRGDGEWLHAAWGQTANRWQTMEPGRVVSYKVHVARSGRIPPDARIVCFHGHPRPWQTALWAQRRGQPHGNTASAP